ncbi:hypothetical protein [Caldicellulosiruptor acetigenus]|uniref:hypothetical protein n=1 Tax=Caldicellulosiruptor acetigenus TaxID=301953 RepID=UPI0002E6B6E6|nr:hypothetical protein [Caldicellulosiruptor acetigenus]
MNKVKEGMKELLGEDLGEKEFTEFRELLQKKDNTEQHCFTLRKIKRLDGMADLISFWNRF